MNDYIGLECQIDLEDLAVEVPVDDTSLETLRESLSQFGVAFELEAMTEAETRQYVRSVFAKVELISRLKQ